MHASDRNRLAKRYQMLLFASSDMWHAQAAANAWAEKDETDPVFRVLHTGMIVIYARPFSSSNFVQLDPDCYRPDESGLADLHDLLLRMRNRAAAHTDEPKKSGRKAGIGFGEVPGGKPIVGIAEEYEIISRSSLPGLLKLFESQKVSFELESEKIRKELRT
jgi:hypothetical protein